MEGVPPEHPTQEPQSEANGLTDGGDDIKAGSSSIEDTKGDQNGNLTKISADNIDSEKNIMEEENVEKQDNSTNGGAALEITGKIETPLTVEENTPSSMDPVTEPLQIDTDQSAIDTEKKEEIVEISASEEKEPEESTAAVEKVDNENEIQSEGDSPAQTDIGDTSQSADVQAEQEDVETVAKKDEQENEEQLGESDVVKEVEQQDKSAEKQSELSEVEQTPADENSIPKYSAKEDGADGLANEAEKVDEQENVGSAIERTDLKDGSAADGATDEVQDTSVPTDITTEINPVENDQLNIDHPDIDIEKGFSEELKDDEQLSFDIAETSGADSNDSRVNSVPSLPDDTRLSDQQTHQDLDEQILHQEAEQEQQQQQFEEFPSESTDATVSEATLQASEKLVVDEQPIVMEQESDTVSEPQKEFLQKSPEREEEVSENKSLEIKETEENQGKTDQSGTHPSTSAEDESSTDVAEVNELSPTSTDATLQIVEEQPIIMDSGSETFSEPQKEQTEQSQKVKDEAVENTNSEKEETNVGKEDNEQTEFSTATESHTDVAEVNVVPEAPTKEDEHIPDVALQREMPASEDVTTTEITEQPITSQELSKDFAEDGDEQSPDLLADTREVIQSEDSDTSKSSPTTDENVSKLSFAGGADEIKKEDNTKVVQSPVPREDESEGTPVVTSEQYSVVTPDIVEDVEKQRKDESAVINDTENKESHMILDIGADLQNQKPQETENAPEELQSPQKNNEVEKVSISTKHDEEDDKDKQPMNESSADTTPLLAESLPKPIETEESPAVIPTTTDFQDQEASASDEKSPLVPKSHDEGKGGYGTRGEEETKKSEPSGLFTRIRVLVNAYCTIL